MILWKRDIVLASYKKNKAKLERNCFNRRKPRCTPYYLVIILKRLFNVLYYLIMLLQYKKNGGLSNKKLNLQNSFLLNG